MIYSGTITNESITLVAGTVSLNCVFKWPDEVQEQYDKWMKMINTAREGNPLVNIDGSRIEDYDYLKFYTETDFETYDGPMPSVVLASADKEQRIKELQMQCTEVLKIVNTLKELLRYTCVINDDTVITVNTGGWYTNPEGWRIRFLSPRESITRDTLNLVTVEVDDGVIN